MFCFDHLILWFRLARAADRVRRGQRSPAPLPVLSGSRVSTSTTALATKQKRAVNLNGRRLNSPHAFVSSLIVILIILSVK